MSKISNLLVDEKIVDVPFPKKGMEDFVVKVAYVNREELKEINSKATTKVIDRKSRQMVDEVDNDKFLAEYTKRAIRGWTGLKIKHLPILLPVNTKGMKQDDLIPYSADEALDLIKNSSLFDQFLTGVMDDVELFSDKEKEEEEKNSVDSSTATSVVGAPK